MLASLCHEIKKGGGVFQLLIFFDFRVDFDFNDSCKSWFQPIEINFWQNVDLKGWIQHLGSRELISKSTGWNQHLTRCWFQYVEINQLKSTFARCWFRRCWFQRVEINFGPGLISNCWFQPFGGPVVDFKINRLNSTSGQMLISMGWNQLSEINICQMLISQMLISTCWIQLGPRVDFK